MSRTGHRQSSARLLLNGDVPIVFYWQPFLHCKDNDKKPQPKRYILFLSDFDIGSLEIFRIRISYF